MTSAQNDLSFLDIESVPYKVNGKELKFYPASIDAMFKLRGIAQKIGAAFAALSADTKADQKFVDNRLSDETGEKREIITDAHDPKIAEMRLKSREKAFENIVDSFFDKSNMEGVCLLIQDSLRDNYKVPVPAVEFYRTVHLPTLTQMLIGACKANKGMFGPLTDRLGGIFARIEQMIAEKVAGQPENSTDGSNSKTASSGQPSEATPSNGS